MVASAIWCAAICSAPIDPSTAVNVAKASISLPNWMPVGRPSAVTSRSARGEGKLGAGLRARARAARVAHEQEQERDGLEPLARRRRVRSAAHAQAGSPACP